MSAMLNPQFKAKYATIYQDVFKPVKEVCERMYDQQNPHGYMNHAQRDDTINEMVFSQLTAEREEQLIPTRDALGKFRQSLGSSEWDNAANYITAFIADVKENGLTAVIMALPKDARMTDRFGLQAPAQSTTTTTAMPSPDATPIHPLSVKINHDLIAQFKAAQAIRA